MSKIIRLCAEIILVSGALACVLVWLKIEPSDFTKVARISPHWMWLLAALVLFALSLASSGMHGQCHAELMRNGQPDRSLRSRRPELWKAMEERPIG
jgi:hypothetical protein